MASSKRTFAHWLTDAIIRGFLSAMRCLPYETRITLSGKVMTNVIAPFTGNRRRIRENLALVMPELSATAREAIVREVPETMGRMLMEMYSANEFSARVATYPITGPGLAALKAAQAEGKGAMLVTGHFGNYLAVRAALLAQGIQVAGLYKKMSNPYFNDHYVAAMEDFGKPVFERGRRGMSGMIKHLRSGGFLGIVQDQRINDAPVMDFMGKPARTATSAAELALKFKLDLVPCYGVRQPDGTYVIQTEAPVPHSTAEEMTKALNDSLEALIRAYPGQWMWTHNRWRGAGNDTSEDRARSNS
ncbi:lysophospholipid acyltransferase family protein [Shimia sp. R10_1]|uniref:lysophospholipid acyltransferase family protein n=1 Tax=Shimia sp. R10_1 TaxID=2821095 RepID=UPI001ADCAEAB|nr:lysophospholipid acyltransferase family protein [Shimia sp. R10_1]MBO9472160.1 lysophospholipid acyltransferase family protein [Shimia sp. R10_1]